MPFYEILLRIRLWVSHIEDLNESTNWGDLVVGGEGKLWTSINFRLALENWLSACLWV